MHSDHHTDSLLEELLSGEISDASLEMLAEKAKDDPRYATKVGEELEFVELLRQAVRHDDPEEAFVTALEAFELSESDLEEKLCFGDPSRAECDRLATLLADSPEGIELVQQHLADDEMLRLASAEAKDVDAFVTSLQTRFEAEQSEDSFVDQFQARLERELQESDQADDKMVPMPSFWSRRPTQIAAAAAVVIAAVGAAWMGLRSEKGANQVVATVVKGSDNLTWGGIIQPSSAGGVEPGTYVVEQGTVALEFLNGGEMTVEGPAIFEVKGKDTAYLHRGVAMARNEIESTRGGLRLVTNDVSFSEPMPLAGIQVDAQNETEVTLFQGDGGVGFQDRIFQELSEFQAVKRDQDSERLIEIPYNPHPFQSGWEMLAGVGKSEGAIRVELPGASIEPTDQQGAIQVFVERDSFLLEEALEVDAADAASIAFAGGGEGEILEVEGELRSYLLQLWPSDGIEGGATEATITFDHEVVGIIYSSDRLAESDDKVGTMIVGVDEAFNRERGLDFGSDSISLSDDRRTLSLKLEGGLEEVDQVRVLVALR